MIHKKTCPICKREFETNRIKAVYCGELCACKARRIKALQYVKKVSYDPIKCVECGKEFVPKNKNSKFCCADCKRIYTLRKNRTGFAAKKCEWCGKDFIPKSASAKYCSKECRNKGMAKTKKETEEKLRCAGRETKKKKNNSTLPDVPASKRWAKMSWKEISAECTRLHISYGQAQVMACRGTLPEDFGEDVRNGK